MNALYCYACGLFWMQHDNQLICQNCRSDAVEIIDNGMDVGVPPIPPLVLPLNNEANRTSTRSSNIAQSAVNQPQVILNNASSASHSRPPNLVVLRDFQVPINNTGESSNQNQQVQHLPSHYPMHTHYLRSSPPNTPENYQQVSRQQFTSAYHSEPYRNDRNAPPSTNASIENTNAVFIPRVFEQVLNSLELHLSTRTSNSNLQQQNMANPTNNAQFSGTHVSRAPLEAQNSFRLPSSVETSNSNVQRPYQNMANTMNNPQIPAVNVSRQRLEAQNSFRLPSNAETSNSNVQRPYQNMANTMNNPQIPAVNVSRQRLEAQNSFRQPSNAETSNLNAQRPYQNMANVTNNPQFSGANVSRAPLEVQNSAPRLTNSANPRRRSRSSNGENSQGRPPVKRSRTMSNYELQRIERISRRQLKEGHTECGICYDGFEGRKIIRRLKCNHAYHQTCIFGWLKKEPTCPFCRYDLVDDDENTKP